MKRTEIIDRFKEILKPYTQNPQALETFSEHTDFIKDLKINSANMVDVFLDAEEAFDIEIDNDSLEKIQNIEDAIEVIAQKVEERDIPTE